MTAFAIIAIGLLTGGDAPQDVSQDIKKAVDALNKAFEDHDLPGIKGRMTKNHVAITHYYGGPVSVADQVKTLKALKYDEYKVSQFKITVLDAETALITYALQTKGAFQGKPLPRKNFVAAVWVKRKGKWLEASYQETILDEQ